MFEKAKNWLKKIMTATKVKLNNMQKPIKYVVIGYFSLVLLLVLTYYIAWIYLWQIDKAALSDLLAIIREMIGPAMIGFITFIAGCFVDLNGNGIPDELEKEGDKNGY